MRVQDILAAKPRKLVTISPDTSLAGAAKLMCAEQVGALLVVDQQALVGVLSERGVICAIMRRGPEALIAPVREAMSDPWLTAAPDTTVLEVMRTMTEERVRHLPVTRGAKLVGIVSIGDVLKSRLAEKDMEIAVLRDVARVYRSVLQPD
jgi:CBS domain-containing protein